MQQTETKNYYIATCVVAIKKNTNVMTALQNLRLQLNGNRGTKLIYGMQLIDATVIIDECEFTS
eukprot:scaffold647863_cov40-Prasinocladus_malaysianus.AAC.3